MRELLFAVMLFSSACQQSAAKPPVAPVAAPAPQPPAPARRGVTPRPDELEKAPSHGLMIQSFGLVNETFKITVDFDTKTLVSVIHYAQDGSDEKTSRTLTAEELAELIKLRETAWTTWTELPRSPASEYSELLSLLDGNDTTRIGAEGGFHSEGSAQTLARRLKELGKAR
jgi:hypothetical protein